MFNSPSFAFFPSSTGIMPCHLEPWDPWDPWDVGSRWKVWPVVHHGFQLVFHWIHNSQSRCWQQKSSTYLIVFNDRGRHAIPALFDHLLQHIVSDSVRQTIPEANFGLTSGANVKVHLGQRNETQPDVTSALLASLQVVLPQQRLPMWGTGVTNDLDHPPRWSPWGHGLINTHSFGGQPASKPKLKKSSSDTQKILGNAGN